MRTAALLTFVLGTACAIPLSAQSQQPPAVPGGSPMTGRPMPHGHEMLPPDRWWDDNGMADRLHITPQQQEKMDSIFDQARPKLIHDVQDLQTAQGALEPMMSAEHPNEPAILSQIDRVAEARASLEKARAQMLLALRAQLTHEQWLLLIKDRTDGPPGSPGFHHRHGGFGPGEGGPPPSGGMGDGSDGPGH